MHGAALPGQVQRPGQLAGRARAGRREEALGPVGTVLGGRVGEAGPGRPATERQGGRVPQPQHPVGVLRLAAGTAASWRSRSPASRSGRRSPRPRPGSSHAAAASSITEVRELPPAEAVADEVGLEGGHPETDAGGHGDGGRREQRRRGRARRSLLQPRSTTRARTPAEQGHAPQPGRPGEAGPGPDEHRQERRRDQEPAERGPADRPDVETDQRAPGERWMRPARAGRGPRASSSRRRPRRSPRGRTGRGRPRGRPTRGAQRAHGGAPPAGEQRPGPEADGDDHHDHAMAGAKAIPMATRTPSPSSWIRG